MSTEETRGRDRRTGAETAMEDEREPRGGRRPLAQMVAVGVVASAIGIAIGLAIDWFPLAGSTQAKDIDTLWDVLVIATVPIFVLVMVVVGISILDFRMRPGEENLDGPPIHGNTRLEIIWTALPALLIVSLCAYAYVVLRDIEESPASGRERVVNVTGQQFAWTFEYNEGGRKFTNTQLYLPIGESVKFRIRSRDVIHDFWVPNFRMKIDAVPGITTSYRVTPTRLGEHAIVCAELCGLGHAYMRQTAHVLTREDFRAWVRRASRPAQAGAGTAAAGAGQGAGTAAGGAGGAGAEGKEIFTAGNQQTGATACGGCHKLADAGTQGGVGPDLDRTLRGRDAAFIERAIVDPNAEVARGYAPDIMPPNYKDTLTPQQLRALVDYLARVTR
jgi:cytochrome c oxidase subunit 2